MPRPYPIYAVDDDPGIRRFISALCEDRGLTVYCFEHGEPFLAAFDRLEPGCVILDMRMPRLHGLQVLEEMARRDGIWPVIVVTGYADVEMAVDSMRMGAVDFLEKPISEETLFEAVEAAFRRLDAANGPDGP